MNKYVLIDKDDYSKVKNYTIGSKNLKDIDGYVSIYVPGYNSGIRLHRYLTNCHNLHDNK